MSEKVKAWKEQNINAHKLCSKILKSLLAINNDKNPSISVCAAFLAKSTDTLAAINVLYDHKLEESAQALIRVLFEVRLNFDIFAQMAGHDTGVFMRLLDSMMLEKLKQIRAANLSMNGALDKEEKRFNDYADGIAKRYSPEDFNAMRKHGFSGVSVEQMAIKTGHQQTYDAVYRNFSRNVHATDYMEIYMKSESAEKRDNYTESRDVVAHYTAHVSIMGITERINHMFSLGFDLAISDLAKRQIQIKTL